MLATIIQFFNIEQGQIEIALDGLSALNQAKKCTKDLLVTQSCYDLLQDISNRLKMLPEGIKIKWRHVEGHQKEKGYKKLDFWALMNGKADKHAKSYLQKCIKNNRQHEPVQLWYEYLAINVNGIKQSNMNKNFIYSQLVKENSYKYWKNHHDFKINEPDDIDWKPLKKAVKRLPVGSQ